MTTQEKIDFIREKMEEGKIVYNILPDQIAVSTLKELCDQSADGILYDLNRGEETILAFASDDNPYWVNNLAAEQVIRYLKGRVEELEEQLKKEDIYE